MHLIHFTTVIFLVLFSASSFAEESQATAVELVSCVNDANDYPVETTEWYHSYAKLELPLPDNRNHLADGFHFISGPYAGHIGTWGAFLDLTAAEWTAYETKAGIIDSHGFPAPLVPKGVISALATCGVEWGGYWAGDYPFIERPRPQPAEPIFSMDIKDLMPPSLPANSQ